jgi:CRP/FNR family cyclic AMP-dependent transcriptional regulator
VGGGGKILPRKSIAEGQVFISEGDEGSHAFFIQTGSVEIFKSNKDGSETVIGSLTQGQVVGEMALIASVPRTASVRAKEPTTVVIIQPEALARKMRAIDPLMRGLIQTFIVMIQRMNQHYRPPPTDLNGMRKEISGQVRALSKFVGTLDHEDFGEECERLLEDMDDLIIDYVGEAELEGGALDFQNK